MSSRGSISEKSVPIKIVSFSPFLCIPKSLEEDAGEESIVDRDPYGAYQIARSIIQIAEINDVFKVDETKYRYSSRAVLLIQGLILYPKTKKQSHETYKVKAGRV